MFQQLQNIQQQPMFGGPPYADPRNRNQAGALAIPEIVQAFQNDPRAQLAARMLQSGGSTNPTAGGGWAWADGIARALQGVAGGYITRQRSKSFEQDQQGVIRDMARALERTDDQRLSDQFPVQPTPQQMPSVEAPQPPAPPSVVQPLPGVNGGSSSGPTPTPQDIAAALTGQQPQQRAPAAPQMPPVAQQPGLQSLVPGATPTSAAAPGGAAGPFRFLASGVVPAVQGARLRPVGQNNSWVIGDRPGASRSGGTRRHLGFDMFSPQGAPMVFDQPVQVSNPRSGGRSGNRVTLRFADGSEWWPMHLPSNPRPGMYGPGELQLIPGLTGTSGRGTPHVHMQPGNDLARRIDPNFYFGAGNRGGGGLQGANAQRAGWWPGRQGPGVAGQQPAPQAAAQQQYAPPQEQPFQAQPITQITTPEPQLPAQPGRPDLPRSPRSERELYARELISSGNPYLIAQARQILDTGMGENNASAREGAERQFQQGQLEYGQGLQNFYGAQGDQRRAQYDARSAERGQGFQQDLLNRQQGFQHNERIGGQQFQGYENERQRQWGTGERIGGQEFQHGENNANRDLQRYQIDTTAQTARERSQDRRTGFFATAQGSRMYQQYQNNRSQTDNVLNGISQFIEMNDQFAGTGGAANNIPIIRDVNRMGSTRIQQLQAITEQLAPTLRQAGSGAMSDRDLQAFRQSIPNVQNTPEANRQIGQRLMQGYRRIQDYQLQALTAVADGNVPEFERNWNTYVNSTSIESGVTYDQWLASIPTVGRNGERR